MQADTEQRKGRDSVWSAPFVILMAVNFFQSMAAFMANATLPVFADSLGATASMVGVVVSSFTLSALLVRPFAGPAFDSFSRKRLLLIAQGIICLSFFAYGFVDSLGVLIAVSFSCMGSYVVLYGYGRGVADMGLFFVVYALCLVVTRPALGGLADRVGTPRVLVFGTICFAASYVALFYAQGLPGFLLAAVIGSAGFGCCAPLLQSMGLASVGIDRRGAASNTMFTGLDLGMLVGPVTGGAVAEALAPAAGGITGGYGLMWLVMIVPALGTLAIALGWSLRGRVQRR